jgi:hypothetical protein
VNGGYCAASKMNENMKKRLSPAKSPLPKFQSDQEPLCCRCVGSIARDLSGQAVTRADEEDSRPPRPTKVSDLASLGPRTDRRGEAHRGGEVGRLPDATPDVDCRGDPPRSEARLTFRPIHRDPGRRRPCGRRERRVGLLLAGRLQSGNEYRNRHESVPLSAWIPFPARACHQLPAIQSGIKTGITLFP